jgi:hypothetical protein
MGEGVVVVTEEDCEPGCKCPDPYVMSENGTCVMVEECAYCLDKDGERLPIGYSWSEPENCRECECTTEGINCSPVECNEDCQWSEWSDFGECSASCEGGIKRRYRNVIGQATGNGTACPDDTTEVDEEPCNLIPCPGTTTPEPEGSTEPPRYCELTEVTQDLSARNGKCVAPAQTMTICAGSCPSQQTLILDFPYTVNNCACCQGNVVFKEVEFECEGEGLVKMEVPQHESCGCLECVAWESKGKGKGKSKEDAALGFYDNYDDVPLPFDA